MKHHKDHKSCYRCRAPLQSRLNKTFRITVFMRLFLIYQMRILRAMNRGHGDSEDDVHDH